MNIIIAVYNSSYIMQINLHFVAVFKVHSSYLIRLTSSSARGGEESLKR